MEVEKTPLSGVLLVRPEIHGDERGHFIETYRAPRYAEAGIPGPFIQDNLSVSRRGVLRGLHLQQPHAQAKLASVVQGEVFDVAVDLRLGSPTFCRWFGARLSGQNGLQLYIPAGFAHGFCVTSETAHFTYKCSAEYDHAAELTVRWDDPDIGIEWPVVDPSLSPRDAVAPRLHEIDRSRLPA